MRGAAAGLALTVTRLGLDVLTPSYGAVRSWLLRLGCYALTRPLPCDRAWVWLIDHTVQIGACKLLVILGCALADVPFGDRPLQLTDLRLVALVPMEHSTQETVAAELERAVVRTGVPRQIVSDQGSDLNGGVRQFQQQHPTTAHVHDLAHQAANVLKQRWGKDRRWAEFMARLAQAGAKLRQTPDAFLLPPTVRPKARFMNVGPTLRFAGRVLRLLDSATPSVRVQSQYGWLREYREELAGWTSEQAVAQAAVAHVRTHGVGRDSAETLDTAWSATTWTPGVVAVAAQLEDAVVAAGAQAAPGESLVGSTEILESAFGKLKRLEGSYEGNGFTGLTLALGALTHDWTEEEVRAALDAVPKKEAEGWVQRLFGTTVHAFRRLFLGDEDVPEPG